MVKTLAEINADRVRVTVELLDRPAEESVWTPLSEIRAMNQKVTQLEVDLTRIRAAVLGIELARELREYRESSAATLMVEALTEVRRVVGASDASVSNGLSSRLYTADEVGDLQASEAELVAAPLRRRVAELGKHLDSEIERADRAETLASAQHERAKEAEKERDRATARVAELEKRLTRFTQQANGQEAFHAQAAAEHIRSIAARDNLLSAATTRIRLVKELLAAPAVTKARDEIVTSKGAVLANAIGNALAALDS